MCGVVVGLADRNRQHIRLLHRCDLQHDTRWEVLLFRAISTFCHEGLRDQRVHITPVLDAKSSSMPMVMTGQYSCTFQSPLAERAYENSGDDTPDDWFADLSSTIQLVTARFIVCIHWSSRFAPSIFTRFFAASLHFEPVSWVLSESKHPGRRSRGDS